MNGSGESTFTWLFTDRTIVTRAVKIFLAVVRRIGAAWAASVVGFKYSGGRLQRGTLMGAVGCRAGRAAAVS